MKFKNQYNIDYYKYPLNLIILERIAGILQTLTSLKAKQENFKMY